MTIDGDQSTQPKSCGQGHEPSMLFVATRNGFWPWWQGWMS